ncbi:MAG: hypothetical protein DMG26_00620 [Acidobacteria bacterium]|nr:MAG: hypothetical protein DMG26_00620 [Acidobacteriota bacterium]
MGTAVRPGPLKSEVPFFEFRVSIFQREVWISMGHQHGRIPMLERDHVAPEVAALYDALEQQRGVVPYMFRTLAHTPALALGIAGFLKALLGDGALPGWYKELVATRVALLVDCDY